MSLTVGEVKENADYNLSQGKMIFQIAIGQQQLANYNKAKELGASDDDDWDDWEDKVSPYILK